MTSGVKNKRLYKFLLYGIMSESIEQCISLKVYKPLCLHKKVYILSDLYSAIARSCCRKAATACAANLSFAKIRAIKIRRRLHVRFAATACAANLKLQRVKGAAHNIFRVNIYKYKRNTYNIK